MANLGTGPKLGNSQQAWRFPSFCLTLTFVLGLEIKNLLLSHSRRSPADVQIQATAMCGAEYLRPWPKLFEYNLSYRSADLRRRSADVQIQATAMCGAEYLRAWPKLFEYNLSYRLRHLVALLPHRAPRRHMPDRKSLIRQYLGHLTPWSAPARTAGARPCAADKACGARDQLAGPRHGVG